MITRQLASIFDEPRIAAIRPLIDQTSIGREITAQLERMPVSLAIPDASDMPRGFTAAYNERMNTIAVPRQLLDTTTANGREVLARAIRHEGVHRIQRARPGGFPSVPSLAVTGARAAAHALRSSENPVSHWRAAVNDRWLALEGEAYLTDYRAATQLGTNVDKEPILAEIPGIERTLDRPLKPTDLVPTLLDIPGYRDMARVMRRRAAAATALPVAGASAVVAGVATLSPSRQQQRP